MTTFTDIKTILDNAVNNASSIGVHGAFWRNVSRNQFVEMDIFGCQIIASDVNGNFTGAESPLVKILRGDINCGGNDFPQMPFGFKPVSEENIQLISDWIDAQCPE
ncbi:MAG: hypothetical protein ABIP06_10505 [Pyrinomonadaceae bacterium]